MDFFFPEYEEPADADEFVDEPRDEPRDAEHTEPIPPEEEAEKEEIKDERGDKKPTDADKQPIRARTTRLQFLRTRGGLRKAVLGWVVLTPKFKDF